MAWLRVIRLGMWQLLLKIAAPIAVLFVDRANHPIWGNSERVISYWDSAFRNSAFNYTRQPQVEFDTWTNSEDDTLEELDGFQWRYRRSKDGRHVSFRVVAGKARSKGKYEFYVGDTMNKRPTMGVTFFQLRLPWYMWGVLLNIILYFTIKIVFT